MKKFVGGYLLGCILLSCGTAQKKQDAEIHSSGLSIVFEDTDVRSGIAGKTLTSPLVVVVRDAKGNPMDGIDVIWVTAGGGTFTGNESKSGSDGRATSPKLLLPNREVALTVTASIKSEISTNASVAVKATSDTPISETPTSELRSIAFEDTNARSGLAGKPLASPLVVMVRDSKGKPMNGVDVAWTTTGGGTFSKNESKSDRDGRAISPELLLPNLVVALMVTASIKSESQIKASVTVQTKTPLDASDSLVAHLKFNEIALATAAGGKDFIDFSGKGNHGIASGSLTLGKEGANAVALNGGQIVLPLLSPNTTNITMSAWFKATDSSSADRIIFYNGSFSQGDGYGLTLNSIGSNEKALMVLVGGGLTSETDLISIGADWHHVALVLENGNAKIYLDGKLVHSKPHQIVKPTLNTTIGAIDQLQNVSFFIGLIADFAFWKSALSEDDIRLVYESTRKK